MITTNSWPRSDNPKLVWKDSTTGGDYDIASIKSSCPGFVWKDSTTGGDYDELWINNVPSFSVWKDSTTGSDYDIFESPQSEITELHIGMYTYDGTNFFNVDLLDEQDIPAGQSYVVRLATIEP